MSGVQHARVTDQEDGMRLDRWFKVRFPNLGFGKLQKLLRTGQVRVDSARAKTNTRLETGQAVRVPPLGGEDAKPAPRPRKKILDPKTIDEVRSWVLCRDKDVIALNKPAGLAVQGGANQPRHLDGLLDALADGGERPRLVHRLDRDTSGVLLLARSARAARWLTAAFRDKNARKLYWALVIGVPEIAQGRIDLRLGKQGGRGGEKMEAAGDGKRAITFYRVIERLGERAAWLAMEPLTGRTHQLRAHAAAMDTPIAGDGKYGGRGAYLKGGVLATGLHLHARRLVVPTPSGKPLDVAAPLPDHMRKSWKSLGLAVDDDASGFIDERNL